MLVTVDTGGTKTLIASFGEDGVMGEAVKFPTPRDAKVYTTTLIEKLKNLYNPAEIDALVVALPGRINNDQVLEYARQLSWENFDLRSALMDHFDCPVLVDHDASLAGLAASRQLGTNPHNCLYVTISTGIGTGLIVDDHIDQPHKQAEGGQIILEYNGELMYWEDFASGQAIKNEYGMFASEIDDPKIWDEIAKKLSRGFFALLPVICPEIVVIGGSIGTYFDLYKDKLAEILNAHLPIVPPFVAAKNPEQIVLFGCYYHALDYLARS